MINVILCVCSLSFLLDDDWQEEHKRLAGLDVLGTGLGFGGGGLGGDADLGGPNDASSIQLPPPASRLPPPHNISSPGLPPPGGWRKYMELNNLIKACFSCLKLQSIVMFVFLCARLSSFIRTNSRSIPVRLREGSLFPIQTLVFTFLRETARSESQTKTIVSALPVDISIDNLTVQ